jgi:hypothetical protein
MDLRANPEETESKSDHQGVSNEEVSMETIGALEDQHGDRHLAAGRD